MEPVVGKKIARDVFKGGTMIKRRGLKVGMAVLVVMCALVTMGGEVLAWGPITHQKIVEDARDRMAPGEIKSLWTDYPQYMYGGAIAPDWSLAYARSKFWASDANEVASHQGEFHSQQFLEAMKSLAQTDEEKAFYYAYETHVISDKHEDELGAAVDPEASDYAREFYVDKMVVANGYHGETGIKICSDLMVEAYAVVFLESEWQPTASQINTLSMANRIYQWLWLPYVSGISVEKGYGYYWDYGTFVAASIQDTQDQLLLLS